MTLPSTPITSVTPASAVAAAPPAARAAGAHATAPATAAGAPVTVDTMPASPPPEVLHAMGTAARAWDRLAQSGRQLQFAVDAPAGRVSIRVADPSGTVLQTLSGAQALAVAAGEPLA